VSLSKACSHGADLPRRRSFMAQPFKHPTSGIYWLRRKVPAEYHASLGLEFKRSLKTRDPAEAKARFAEAWSDSEHAFALARSQAGGAGVFGPQDAQQLAARWFRSEQARLESTGAFSDMLGPAETWGSSDQDEEHTRFETLREGAEQDPSINWTDEVVKPVLARTLRQHSLPVPPKDSKAYALLVAAFDEHIERLSAWALERHEGRVAAMGQGVAPILPIEAERRASSSKDQVHTLRELFGQYSQDKKLNDGDTRATRRTINAYGAIVEGFIELHGNGDVRQISRSTIAQYRGALAKLPAKGDGIRGLTAPALIAKADKEGLPRLSEPTIRNRLRAVSAVLSCGVRLGWLQENPVIAGGAGKAAAKAATRRQSGAVKRKDYTRDELAAIFSSPVFTDSGWMPPRADFGRAWYWLPLLLYYTGARREELAQLAVADVRPSGEGAWHLSILAASDEDDGVRGVKTEGSRRLIPLHPDLVDRGFVAYVASMPASGPLFPLLKPDPKGYFGANFGKRWAAYLRDTVGLNSTASPAHGFRHTFKTLCRDVGIPEDVHDAITGHVGGRSLARDYGNMPLRRMAEEIARIPTIRAQRGAFAAVLDAAGEVLLAVHPAR
jgi:integrase